MPTSSQAMILQGTDPKRIHSSSLTYSCIPFINRRPNHNDINVNINPENTFGRCEHVQFDFNVFTNSERSVDGFEGVFAYDQKTKSYRWQIYSLSQKRRGEFPIYNHENGDHRNEEPCESDSLLLRQSSEYNGHFTTPSESGISNESDESQEAQQNTTHKEEIYCLDEATYRRLEELGFRKRTTYTSGGGLAHMSKEEKSLPKSPQKCSSEPLATVKQSPKLSVKNLEKDAFLNIEKPGSGEGFKPQAFVCGDSMRKRVQPTKKKSLLEEVKESVSWANRVTPSTHYRPGSSRILSDAVCFSLRESWKYDHVQVKDLVECQTQCEVKNLQFDPVSLRTSDRSVLDRWIVMFSSSRHCTKAIERGLTVGGDKVVVRAWEDIMREEQGEDWCYPCTYRLPSEKHDRVIRRFLQVH